jgi:lipopolysaccharide transport system ATP-binding protein
MTNSAISVSHLGKRYLLGENSSLLGRLGLWRRLRGQPAPPAPSSFWALDDVNFEIGHGEAVGIIGHNGAGKSTLLKVLSRITEPSRGRAVIEGRVASLLEVGTGFHPELTGRENIFMNGSILGMRRAEIERSFDEIVAFADVEKFLDTPVKRYSSGMYVRLAFSVAAHLEPEILIVDEVLAVGDIQFQKKCLGKMGDVSRSGRTVLFVSHNMAAVRQLTSRCLLMKKGNVCFDGSPDKAIDLYSDATGAGFEQGSDLFDWPRPSAELDRTVEFKSLSFDDRMSVFEPDEDLVIDVLAVARKDAPEVRISGTIFHAEGNPVGSFFSSTAVSMRAGEEKLIRLALRSLRLVPGGYSFGLALVQGNEKIGHRDFDIVTEVLPFEVAAIQGEGGTLGAWARNWGSIRFAPPPLQEMVNG